MKIHEQITKETWTRGTLARTKYGFPVNYLNEDACKWCLDGWLYKIYYNPYAPINPYYSVVKKIETIIEDLTSLNDYVAWNDNKSRTFEEVLELLKKADI